ncbi:MAG: DegT/DnrJ/EryC1/StrS family aminotransferase [Nitrospirae bacterium]|nr:DegT/DnrJ/EryC1/StrS family aminotransferase [Nitrospirota bacterium]
MIPMLDLKKEFLEIQDEVIGTVTEILKSTRYVLGPHVEEFEKQFSRFLTGSDVNGLHSLGVASGTGALFLSLASLSIKKGDEVITTPFTFFATVESILYMGAKPVFVDIDDETLNIDVNKIEDKITKKTRAILPVHLFGLPCNMDRVMDIANSHNLHVIEDCAQSTGAQINGRRTGTFGDTGCFSFYPSKNLGCYGDGGAVVTKSDTIYERIRTLRNHGSCGNYVHHEVGFNSRLDEIQAGVLLIKLRRLDEKNRMRRENANLYTSLLKDVVRCPAEPDGYVHSYHQYTIRSAHRDKIKETLANEGISSVVYYPSPIHLQEALKGQGLKRGDLPVSEQAASEVLSLPVYPEMPAESIRKVADIIQSCL